MLIRGSLGRTRFCARIDSDDRKTSAPNLSRSSSKPTIAGAVPMYASCQMCRPLAVSGFRARNYCIPQWIYADQAKGGRDIHVSLNATAIEVLTKHIGKHQTRVFSFRGRPINQVNTKAWKSALKRAGIAKFRWHDLRHYMGQLVDPEWSTAKRNSGDGRVAVCGDGEAVRSPGSGAVRTARESGRRTAQWHVYVTNFAATEG